MKLKELKAGDEFALNGDLYRFQSNGGAEVTCLQLRLVKTQVEPGVFVDQKIGISTDILAGDTEVEAALPSVAPVAKSPSPLSGEDLKDAFRQAQSNIVVKRDKLSQIEILVALQRKWHHVYADSTVPEDPKVLIQLIPSGIKHAEKISFLRGSLEEAKKAWLNLLNISWTKKQLQEKTAGAGVPNALRAFDAQTQTSLSEAVKMLSD